MNLEQEVGNVFIAVSHTFKTFYLIIDPFGDGGRYFTDEVVQNEVPFSKELVTEFDKHLDFRPNRSDDPLPQRFTG